MPTASNHDIARILGEIGEYLAMQEMPFKPRAYEKAADAVAAQDEELSVLYQKNGKKALLTIPGVGEGIGKKIEELIKTGRLKYYEQLQRGVPVNLGELTAVEGLGPKLILKLYEQLQIRNLSELEAAAKAGKIRALEGFGLKKEQNILKGIEFVKKSGGRFVLGFVMPEICRIEEHLKKVKGVEQVTVAGSIRRRKETVGDMDVLMVAKDPTAAMQSFVSMPGVMHVYAHGSTKSMVRLAFGMDVDLRIVPKASYGAALNYFTGSKDHNVALREIALKKGMTLNEYGLYKIKNKKVKSKNKGELVAGKTEEEIYKALGLSYIEPELREMTGELEAAKKNALPKLIGYNDLKGDLQVQTSWTDGTDSIEEMARAAAKTGLKYIAVTDHSKYLAMAWGLDEKRLLQQGKEIDKVNAKFKKEGLKMTVLKGIECDILRDGRMDLSDSALSKLDVVGGSIHSHFKLTREQQTARVIRAMENPNVDIIFHLTTREIKKRDPIELDIEKIIAAAKRTKTVLEIDAYPDRADIRDEYVKRCVQAGVKMSIDSDSHATGHFQYLECGIAQARRGWATREDIINTFPVEKMLKILKHR